MKTRSWMYRTWAFSLALTLVAVGCAPDIPQDEDVTRTQTAFNPDESIIPLPSDLALDDDGTLPALPGHDEASAQGDFLTYLDGLHGWLPATDLTIPVAGPVDEDSLTDQAVVLFRLDEDGDEQLEVSELSFDEESLEIQVTPTVPLEFGTRYGYVLTQQVTDPESNPLVANQTLFFATLNEPLVEEDEEGKLIITHDLLAGAATPEEAQQLEGLRQFMKPVVDAAVEVGVERSRIVSMSVWTTAMDAFTVFDPATGEVPFPNEFVRSGEGGTVALPVPEGADELTTGIINELNRRDGFSITADGWIPIQGAALDPATVNQSNIPVAFVPGALPSLYEEDRYFTRYDADSSAILFGPLGQPFVQGRTNAGIVLTEVKDVNGRDIKPTPAFVFLRSKSPVFKDGESTVEQLDNATAAQLEPARQAYQQLFTAALVLGYPDRSQIANAWAFETDESTRDQQELNAKAIALANESGSPSAQGDPADAQVAPTGFDNVGLIHSQAGYTTQFFIDGSAEGGLADVPVGAPVPMTIAVPETVACGVGPFPVVIAGFIDGQTRAETISVLADTLAASPHCLVTVAPGFLFEGDRAVEGVEFLSANPIATKNNMLQAVVDLAVLVEVIKDDGLEGVLSANPTSDLVDETSIGYAGLSVGSLVGTNFLATVPEVSVGALNEPGAKNTQIVLEGELAAILPQELVDMLGTFEGFRTFSFLQWVLEHADPWTFARHVQSEPLAELSYDIDNDDFNVDEDNDIGDNQVLIQMAGDDQVIPNSTTERLADAIGVSLDDTTFPGMEHLFITGESDAAGCAREQIAVWLASGLSGDAELGASEESACGLAN